MKLIRPGTQPSAKGPAEFSNGAHAVRQHHPRARRAFSLAHIPGARH